jgi:N-acetylglucosaminyldiphosphoundecaprenol N-acetyl-beta-D-mannosaminyltransferase
LVVLSCAGIPIWHVTLDEAVDDVLALALKERRSGGVDVHFCNAWTISLADRDPDLADLLLSSSRNFPDGKPIVWSNRMRRDGRRIPRQQVPGPDVFERVFRGSTADVRHFLLGGSPEVLDALEQRLRHEFPQANIVGTISPPFRSQTPAETARQDDEIRTSSADIVWVGLGTPKQDFEAARLARDVGVVAVAVGAAFDFTAGSSKRAPAWMGRAGLEWVYRLRTEPKRLWRRYLLGNARFVRVAWRRR